MIVPTQVGPIATDIIEATRKQLFVGGEWRDAARSAAFEVEDPGSAEVLCAVADADVEDGLAALDAAWRNRDIARSLSPGRRAKILRDTAGLLESRVDELATLITLEMGKPLLEAQGEVAYAVEYLMWFAGEAERLSGLAGVTTNGSGRTMIERVPVGPCLLITPWNFPAAMGARKIAPAIAAGCTMVVKPSPATPLSMLWLAARLEEAGLPDGVLNVVPTTRSEELVAAVLSDRRLRKLSFTGSTEVGRQLLKQAAQNVLRASMELGGNAPFIVFGDADLDTAITAAIAAKTRNGGQACTAANRFFVHEDLHDAFVTRFAERMAGLKVGHGLEPTSQIGPLVEARQRERVAGFVADSLEAGAELVTGGSEVFRQGYFYEPTVLADLASDCGVLEREIFGPIAPICRFTDEDAVIETANSGDAGLVAYICTRDRERAIRLGKALEVGMLGHNTGVISSASAPFGGVKHSGLGREGGPDGIDEYLESKYLVTAD